MKKVFATLAACAVAVSMFAVAGCGGNKGESTPEGAIPGDYKDANEEEIQDALDSVLGGEDNEGGISGLLGNYNYGLKINLTQNSSVGSYQSSSASVNADFKIKSTDDGLLGEGTAKVNYDLSLTDNLTYSEVQKISLEGKAYLQDMVIYAIGSGTSSYESEYGGETDEGKNDFNDKKAKVNLGYILADFAGDSEEISTSPTDADVSDSSGLVGGWQNYLNVANLLALAKEYKISVGLDTDDGVKIRLSASEETLWTILSETLGEDAVTTYKDGISFNKFLFNVYFSLDTKGACNGASIVVDIDAKIDQSLLTGGSDEYAAVEAAPAVPKLAASLKGSIELYTHNESINVPDGLADDEDYYDATDLVIEYFDYFFGDEERNNDFVQGGPVDQY